MALARLQMPRTVRNLMPLPLGTLTQVVWMEERLHSDLWSGNVKLPSRTVYINLKPDTWITGVALVYDIVNEVGLGTQGEIRVNGVKVATLTDTWSGSVDVTSAIYEGANIIGYTMLKTAGIGWGNHVVTMNLVISYEGSPPDTSTDGWLPDWWPYAAVGGVLGLAGIILLVRR